MAKAALKYRLTQVQLRSLTVAQRPTLNKQGNVVLEPGAPGKHYRIADDSPGALIGFGFYVGRPVCSTNCAPNTTASVSGSPWAPSRN